MDNLLWQQASIRNMYIYFLKGRETETNSAGIDASSFILQRFRIRFVICVRILFLFWAEICAYVRSGGRIDCRIHQLHFSIMNATASYRFYRRDNKICKLTAL